MKNKVAIVLKSIAWWTFGLGFIMGFFASSVEVPSFTSNFEYVTNTEFSLTILLAIWGSSFVSGMLFLGFAEIIELLQQLVNRSVSKEQLEIIKIDEVEYKKEKLYNELIRKKSIATTITEFNSIKNQLQTMIDYRDTMMQLEDINMRIDNIQKDIIIKQENKDKEIKLDIERKEKRKKQIYNIKSKLTKRSSIFIIVIIMVFSFIFINYLIMNKTKLMVENWQGRWRPVAGNSFTGRLDINIEKGLVGICNSNKCLENIKVDFDKYDALSISFEIDGDKLTLTSRDDELVDLLLNGNKTVIKRFSSSTKMDND